MQILANYWCIFQHKLTHHLLNLHIIQGKLHKGLAMKALLKSFIILYACLLTSRSYAFPEIPFCPAGGPPGWLNYFNDKRDQNIWHRYSRYTPGAYHTGQYRGNYVPAYNPEFRRYDSIVRPNTYILRY
jgi:hypothetical protein